MTLTSFSRSSLTNSVRYEDMLVGNSSYIPPSFESIATAAPTSGTSVTFSSIPSTYKSLQIRANVITGAGSSFTIYGNSDNGTNVSKYASHTLYGTGAIAGGRGFASGTGNAQILALEEVGTIATYPNVFICDIIDYVSTTKYKTIKTFSGADKNATGGSVELNSTLWMDTTALSSITINMGAGYLTGTSIALYGVK